MFEEREIWENKMRSDDRVSVKGTASYNTIDFYALKKKQNK